MGKRKILRLGNPKLYEESVPIHKGELESLNPVIRDLQDTLSNYRKEYGKAGTIAAPQIGVTKRLIYADIDEPKIIINPVLYQKSEEMTAIWDNSLSFPNLFVRLERHKTCMISYRDEHWNKQREFLKGKNSILLQHACDLLYGILATSRAMDGKSFALESERDHLRGRFANS